MNIDLTRKVRNFLYFCHSEEKFNLTVDFCTNIENNTEDPAYAAVEKEVQQYKGRRQGFLAQSVSIIGIFYVDAFPNIILWKNYLKFSPISTI